MAKKLSIIGVLLIASIIKACYVFVGLLAAAILIIAWSYVKTCNNERFLNRFSSLIKD